MMQVLNNAEMLIVYYIRVQEVQYITDEKDEKKKKAAFGRKKIA